MPQRNDEARPTLTERLRPQRLLFFAAAGFGALGLPIWLLAHTLGLRLGVGRIEGADWHAHEMLFGYALAVVGGFLTRPLPRPLVIGIGAIWLVARAAAQVAPFGPVHALASAGFAIALVALAAPKLLLAPSQLRNRLLGPVVVAICLTAVIAPFAGALRGRLFLVALDLYVLLLTFMSGRLIAAAAAGAFHRRGQKLMQRVQPRIETSLFALLLLIAACDLLALPEIAAEFLVVLAAIVSLVRWLRWRLWSCLGSWNLVALGLANLWLSIGLALRASRTLPLWVLPSDALHGLTVGALGAMTLLVMGRTRAMTCGVDPERSVLLTIVAALVNGAAAMRLLAGLARVGLRTELLLWSAVAWAAGCAVLLWFFAGLRRPERHAAR